MFSSVKTFTAGAVQNEDVTILGFSYRGPATATRIGGTGQLTRAAYGVAYQFARLAGRQRHEVSGVVADVDLAWARDLSSAIT